VNSQPQKRTISEIIHQQPLSRFQIWTIFVCGLVLVLDGFDSQAINFLAPSIADATHIPIHTFGPIFSASLVGLMIAALATGPIADRWGRKWPVILSTLSFAAFALLTVRATTFRELVVLRFLTGLGLGGAMPNVVALASEYSPKRLLAILVSVLFVGMPLGGYVCGQLSALMVPRWGWHSVLYVGGAIPLAIALLLVIVLPESIQFLAARGKDKERIGKILARIAPEFAAMDPNLVAIVPDRRHEGVPVKHLFTEGRAPATLLLWIPYFMNLLLIYFTGSWMPPLLREEGMSVSAGVTATAFISLGGIFGCLFEGHLVKWRGASVILSCEFALAGALAASLALTSAPYHAVLVMTFLLGFMMIGAQGGLNAQAASFYPTSIRSTGVGWALGVGRIGSIIGPLVGGWLLQFGWKTRGMLLFGAAVAACAGVSILASNLVGGNITAYASPIELDELPS